MREKVSVGRASQDLVVERGEYVMFVMLWGYRREIIQHLTTRTLRNGGGFGEAKDLSARWTSDALE